MTTISINRHTVNDRVLRLVVTGEVDMATCDLLATTTDADVRDTDRILEQAARTLDFTKPIAIIMQGILGYIPDQEEAHSILKRLLDAVPSGSSLAIGDGTKTTEAHTDVERTAQGRPGLPLPHLRTDRPPLRRPAVAGARRGCHAAVAARPRRRGRHHRARGTRRPRPQALTSNPRSTGVSTVTATSPRQRRPRPP
jgi:hypothetical protein